MLTEAEYVPKYPISKWGALCMTCIDQTHASMISGYCILQERCNRCKRVRDLALVSVKERPEPMADIVEYFENFQDAERATTDLPPEIMIANNTDQPVSIPNINTLASAISDAQHVIKTELQRLCAMNSHIHVSGIEVTHVPYMGNVFGVETIAAVKVKVEVK